MNRETSQIIENLKRFTGSEQFYKQMLFPTLKYTEGLKYVATKCNAYWFLTDVLSVCEKLETKLDFISISLFKKENENFCHIIYDDGNGNDIFKQEYTTTDFPLFNNDGKPAIELFFLNKTLLLTSEY
jgi:hypothetical protein